MLECIEECVLHDVFGILAGIHDVHCYPENHRRIPVHQGAKGGRVTLFGGMNQRWIIASVRIVLFVPQ